MSIKETLKRVKEGIGRESSTIEYKLSKSELSRDIWETISAYSNEGGGLILLGYEKTRKSTFQWALKIHPRC